MSGVSRDLSGEATLESGPEGSLHPVAPGIVAITAAGHTPGSQMLFLRLKSGREILLTGDVAWQEATLEQHSPRARLVSWIMREDDEAITHQLRAILDLKRSTPSLDVVVAHDIPAMDRRFAAGSVGSAFR
jgi:glyoxylase-like metal-dependent hydrolase (beta-lactamase superfamily II)